MWNIWIDTGGTFTDCFAKPPQGTMQRLKVLSSGHLRGTITYQPAPNKVTIKHNWPVSKDIFSGYSFAIEGHAYAINIKSYSHQNQTFTLDRDIPKGVTGSDFSITAAEEAPILAARLATQTPLSQKLPTITMRLGSTRGTNALLERKGAKTLLLITEGFKDLMYIGTQQRPNLFEIDIPEPNVLYDDVLEVPERLDASGNVIIPLTSLFLENCIQYVKQKGYESVAIVLLHAYRNPMHEQRIAEALEQAGVKYISTSQALSPTIKLLPRARTTLVNAYLKPIIHEYLGSIAQTIGAENGTGKLLVMTSSGGLVPHANFQPKDSLLSGPAGGVVGAATIGHQIGLHKLLTLDMGGTSTDTARYDQIYDYQFHTTIDNIEMNSPALAIETVAAGGGSICWFDGQKLQVGPHSAGAQPGPAAYGAGGPLTITDVNLLLGKMQPERMSIPLRPERSREALERLRQQVEKKTGHNYEPKEILEGLEAIANEKMAEAIRRISVAKGFNPSEYALLAFGGAGGLHAAQVAELLQIKTLILPFDGGLLSAYGIGHAEIERLVEIQVLQNLHDPNLDLELLLQNASKTAQNKLLDEGFTHAEIFIRQKLLFLRFAGQNATLEIDYTAPSNTPDTLFKEAYIQLFGYYPPNRTIELESVRVIASSKSEITQPNTNHPKKNHLDLHASDNQYPNVYWPDLSVGNSFSGPALILSDHSSFFLPRDWSVLTYPERNLIVQKEIQSDRKEIAEKEAIELELFTNRFMSIAEDMGAQLQRTAFSVNVKERLDFSCAILNPKAELLVNAPHIPVHLGSLGICARLCLEVLPLQPGDVILTNHPKYGGSHLPDVTILMGTYTDQGELIGYLINRAHHAEIGGKRPGSMPPDARTLAEEGVAFSPVYLVKDGSVRWAEIEAILKSGDYPTRSIAENIADLRAALASLRYGAEALKNLVQLHSLDKVHKYMKRVQQTASTTLEEGLKAYLGNVFRAEEYLDDGHRLAVCIDFRQKPYIFDFSGTAKAHPFNLNANISIVYSAVLYVLRLLCTKPVPLNEGLMASIRIRVPPSLLHPQFEDDPNECPAVVGGNTEVSQRLVDTLLKALSLVACSQGTMNNLLFGNEHFGYYETIGGGTGAGDGFNGRSGVHQHMTNTRMTDPEELELKYPVRLWEFGLRLNSGGDGQWKGGNGIIRELEFLEPVDFTLISQHRIVAPYGMKGGENGMPGQQWLQKKNGTIEPIKGITDQSLSSGDRIRLETPGGGGYGKKES
ncbi:MAG: hydantoinase B/oxoprolinase family protein [Saprospiraceae bacterium]|nr:hydantoinase B/oxoprolinase family protein [Saprospiraceae bacterium]